MTSSDTTMAVVGHRRDGPLEAWPDRWLSGRWEWVCLVGLVTAYLVLGGTAAARVGLTVDEPIHIGVGYLVLTQGEYRLDRVHPPLARMWMALPLLFKKISPPVLRGKDLQVYQYWTPLCDWFQVQNSIHDTLPWPRRMILLIGAALIVAVWFVLRRQDRLAGLIAAALLAFSPHILAHGGLATTDMALILLYPLAAVAFWWASGSVRPAGVLLAGVVIGLALLSKFVAVVLVPVCVILAVVRIAQPTPIELRWGEARLLTGRLARAAAQLGLLCGVGVVCYVMIWAAYRFRYSAGPPDTQLMVNPTDGAVLEVDAWKVEDWQWGRGVPVLQAMRRWRVLPEAYINGVLILMYQQTRRHAFFMGHDNYEGWWYYFPAALLLKTPVSMLAALGTGLWLAVAGWWRARDHWRWRGGLGWPALAALAVFAAVTMSSHVNIGLRHFLPVLPLLLLIAAVPLAGWARQSRANLGFVGALVVWQAAVAVWIWPDYLAYFNVLIGGPSQGYNYLIDSNLDWGQDLPRLRALMDREGIDQVKMGYFGSAYPATYGIKAERLPESPTYPGNVDAILEPGVYVLSATLYQGLYSKLTRLWMVGHESRYRRLLQIARFSPERLKPKDVAMLRSLAFHRLLCRLRNRPPDYRVGYSIFVYRVGREEFDQTFLPEEAALIRTIIERPNAHRPAEPPGRGPDASPRSGGKVTGAVDSTFAAT